MHHFSGRFKEKTSEKMLGFHSSIGFDQRLYRYDIMGSIAHVRGLAKQEIIDSMSGKIIEDALFEILKDIEDDKIEFSLEYEDIHMNIEKILIDRVGDVGKKLHTGRSRNDQVALDMKLFAKDEVKKIQKDLLKFLKVINNIASNNLDTYMPGFTHLQKAQPITYAHYILAYGEMLKRDYERLENAISLADFSPLGSAALAGTTYPLDRDYTAQILGFKGPTLNSLDSVSDRDYLIELMSSFAIIMMHLSRMAEEIIIYSSNEFKYLELSDQYATGSSIMPQKKNPDAAELVRGKSGRVAGNFIALLTTMKGTPLAYNKDMQEDKESFFDSVDTVKGCLNVFIGMLSTIEINKEKMVEACNTGFINATDVADYLAKKGMNFRDAYKIVGAMVSECIEKNITLDTLDFSEYKKYSELFKKDIYVEISIKNCVEKRKSKGGPGKESIKNHIELLKTFIENEEIQLANFKLNDILE
ncbi:MAG: argininosuccinate lyase [Fusobacteriaceae bacterium]